MNLPKLYRGLWPQNVSKLAKYGIRFVDGEPKVTVLYEVEAGLRYLAVHGGQKDLIARVNAIKLAFSSQPGGAFYVNEYRHVLVPVAAEAGAGSGSRYYCAGRLADDLTFEFEGKPLTTRPVGEGGTPLVPGARWVGPRPGIPYVLSAGGSDIHFESPALTEADPPELRPNMTRRVQLSKVLGSGAAAGPAARLVSMIRGYSGGRFYVNEHGAIFTPVDAGDGNGLDYVYCGQLDRSAWFPEPPIAE